MRETERGVQSLVAGWRRNGQPRDADSAHRLRRKRLRVASLRLLRSGLRSEVHQQTNGAVWQMSVHEDLMLTFAASKALTGGNIHRGVALIAAYQQAIETACD